MKNFKILHPIGGVLNHNMDRGLYEFEQICSIDCESLEQAFKLSQNDFSERYASLCKRSTSVGDIIIDTEELIHYMVAGIGFKLLDVMSKNESDLNSLENQSNEQ